MARTIIILQTAYYTAHIFEGGMFIIGGMDPRHRYQNEAWRADLSSFQCKLKSYSEQNFRQMCSRWQYTTYLTVTLYAIKNL